VASTGGGETLPEHITVVVVVVVVVVVHSRY